MMDERKITKQDCYLFNEGRHFNLYDKLGATVEKEKKGTYFAVWAPNAEYVSVIGEFNDWEKGVNPLFLRQQSGIWEGRVPEAKKGQLYKFFIKSKHNLYEVEKADPFGHIHEQAPHRASRIWDLDYDWKDKKWMEGRKDRSTLNDPMSIYEVHLGSWMRKGEKGEEFLTYIELAEKLVPYVKEMGFTHVELMPPMAHPYYDSWGYQVSGYFAPTSRYGTPQDFMLLVDQFHQNDIGVIIDWVPSHFPTDEHALQYFDGTHLFEHADPRQGFHPDWGSSIFNYSRFEVKSFLISNALFWIDKYHADALRVDAVASMLYLDYSRKDGEWIANEHGGRENTHAIKFLQELNHYLYANCPGVQIIAEESTAWPLVSKPVDVGGLGFGMKWNMGWMHDTLRYLSRDPVYRSHHQNELTFSSLYAFSENYILPLSHDEVVHMKGSLIGKMPGDRFQKFANLRLLYGYMFTHPGKKLLFMGGEFAQFAEWNNNQSLDWHLLENDDHRRMQQYVKDLNFLYRNEKALNELDFDPQGFEWIDCHDYLNSVLVFIRRGKNTDDPIIVVLNFTPQVIHNYQIGVPFGGEYKEILNSDHLIYAGSGVLNQEILTANDGPYHQKPYSYKLTLPPLGVSIWKRCQDDKKNRNTENKSK